MRQQLAVMKPDELRRSREHWRSRARVEDEQRLQEWKEEAWELFRKQPGRKPNTKKKVRAGVPAEIHRHDTGPFSTCKGQENYLHQWMHELQRVAQEEERKLEAKEQKRMGNEDARSRSRQS